MAKWAGPKDLMQNWHGLPIWVWVVIAGAGLWILTKIRSNNSSNSNGATAANTAGTNPVSLSSNSSNNGIVSSQNGTVLTSYNSRQKGYTHPGNITINPGGPMLALCLTHYSIVMCAECGIAFASHAK